jgi:multimeric flavodoxin WrbA
MVDSRNIDQLKVIGIAGSPRRDGNTDHLLRQVIDGASSQGAKTKTIILSELNISPCRHCDGCIQTGKCVIDDDMQRIHTDLREADRIILASPIFFMGVTAQTKAMIDRCQALWVIKYVLKMPVAINPDKKRTGFFVSVGGTRLRHLFEPAMATVKSWYTTLDITYAGELVFPGIDDKGAIDLHPSALKDAFTTGQELASRGIPT